ncbi:unnamed protein product [Clonostachys byssicola]|uniref:Protein SYG1 n=1 Tax=Clonostachys byssicola TaxID=160290 RepID=A0A9N9UZM6_9HYPO|nr:unnamed protein product [Clonostachys byssicola]
MKFAKELEREAVPEWRIKYLNYKAGKKHVKAVARAINRATGTPRSLGPRTPTQHFFTPSMGARRDFESKSKKGDASPLRNQANGSSHRDGTQSAPIPFAKRREDESLTQDGNSFQYGSFVATPPATESPLQLQKTATFELPGPAMRQSVSSIQDDWDKPQDTTPTSKYTIRRSLSDGPMEPPADKQSASKPLPKRSTTAFLTSSPSQHRRLFTMTRSETAMGTLDAVRQREAELYAFMDSELDKVETFYKMKEEQAGERLALLKEQLHEMRNRRIQEIAESRQDGHHHKHNGGPLIPEGGPQANDWVGPIKAKMFRPGPNSKALQNMTATPHISAINSGDAARDYIRRPKADDVSYRTAKHKLKLALQEFYRGLELLKSYAMTNRTAFRKLNKKFDKAVNARPPLRYINEKVTPSWFVQSDVLEGHIKTVEDLYARYFERGNHKLAAGKLRSLNKKHDDKAGSSFQNGFLIGTGVVFTVQAVIYAAALLSHDDEEVRTQTSYLMQIYGGYLLALLLFSLFCINCMIWTRNKINYPFIFEFDQRHNLHWTHLAEFPSFFFLIFGIVAWVNFSGYGPESFYIYYPVVLIGFTAIILFLPLPFIAYRSRRWFAYSHWRLLLAGLYPVEFRDFFLGDIYCSLTYFTANIELFFCLYARGWNDPDQCNSSHSRLMGFLTALPPIWRFLQCLRRYYDTRNVFPHLANGGKYTMSIMAAVTLSMYRIENTREKLALFITFSLLNSIYCSIWDLFMDFSLLQAGARHIGLRDILALKKRWPYYTIIVLDPLIRFAWIFYAIFTHDRQHSTLCSFFVAFAEVLRRGMWTCFRVENEHCGNVSQYKASRDVPLPYTMEPLMDRPSTDVEGEGGDRLQALPASQTPQQVAATPEAGQVTGSSTAVTSTVGGALRRRDTTAYSVSKLLAEAHKQDFEKKRKSPQQAAQEAVDGHDGPSDDDDEDSVFDVSEAESRRRTGDVTPESQV